MPIMPRPNDKAAKIAERVLKNTQEIPKSNSRPNEQPPQSPEASYGRKTYQE